MSKHQFLFATFFFLMGSVFSVFALEGVGTVDASTFFRGTEEHMLMLARSDPTFRVTPGDVYTLTFLLDGEIISHTIVVDTAYRLRVANLGIVNGAGQTFAQVRARVEAVVANNIPLSGPQLTLTQPAVFRVFIAGEVQRSGEHSAWALTRLASLVDENLTRFASTRDVSIRSANGQTQIFDLFRFWRFGDQTQNPYLRPGDVVTFNRVSRLVTIHGSVERPGAYQLLEGENIRELIEFYGGGFTPLADPTRMEVVRYLNSEDVSGNRLFLTPYDLENNFVLENYDAVTIPAISDLRPVLFVEGAVDIDPHRVMLHGFRINDDLVATNRLTVQFHTGETFASMVQRNRGWFSSLSDTENARIIRRCGEILPINLNRALFDASYRSEVLIQDHDTLIVPFRQFFVTVAGGVTNPGRFPFIPDRDWEYYIGLAGGFNPTRNVCGRVTITDASGRRLGPNDPIGPETIITARTNSPFFWAGQVAPVLSVILSALTIFLLVNDR